MFTKYKDMMLPRQELFLKKTFSCVRHEWFRICTCVTIL